MPSAQHSRSRWQRLIEEHEIPAELRRLGLWRSAPAAANEKSARGFASRELAAFCAPFIAKVSAARRGAGVSPSLIRKQARRLRRAADALRNLRRLRVMPAPWTWIPPHQIRPEMRLPPLPLDPTDAVLIIGAFEEALDVYADALDVKARRLESDQHRKLRAAQLIFRRRWWRFAHRRSGGPLHEIGARLYAIVFSVPVRDRAAYRQAVLRDKKRYPGLYPATKAR